MLFRKNRINNREFYVCFFNLINNFFIIILYLIVFFCCQSKPALNPRFFFFFFFVLFFHFFFFIISKKILLHTHTHPDFPHYLLVVVFWLLIDFFHSFSLPNKTQFVLCVLHRVPSDHFLLGFCFPCASIIELVFFFCVAREFHFHPTFFIRRTSSSHLMFVVCVCVLLFPSTNGSVHPPPYPPLSPCGA